MLQRACARANLVDKFRHTLEQLTGEKDTSLRTTQCEPKIRACSLLKLISVRKSAVTRLSDPLQAASSAGGEYAISMARVA